MADEFKIPDFSSGQIEIRVDNDGVAIYGTREGLKSLAHLIDRFASRPASKNRTEHVHLEDHGVLTPESLNAAIAYFE